MIYVYDLACNGWPVAAALPLPRVVDVFPVAAVESMRKKKKHKNPREQKRGSRALVMPAERASLGETPRQLKGTGTGICPQEKARIAAGEIEAAKHLLPRELPPLQTSMQLQSTCQRFSAIKQDQTHTAVGDCDNFSEAQAHGTLPLWHSYSGLNSP